MPAHQCQCHADCKQPAVKGHGLCKTHRNRCPVPHKLSGHEPVFKPGVYNDSFVIQDTHNCYAYAFNHYDKPSTKDCNKQACDVPFHQPGRRAGYPKWEKVKGKRCPDVVARVLGDVPGVKLSNFTRRCPRGSSKVALVVDPENDYHWYRQDKDGYWSHKPGGTKVTRKDASGHRIYRPDRADRDYTKGSGTLNYKQFCTYMCVPRNKTFRLKRGGGRRASRISKRQTSS